LLKSFSLSSIECFWGAVCGLLGEGMPLLMLGGRRLELDTFFNNHIEMIYT